MCEWCDKNGIRVLEHDYSVGDGADYSISYTEEDTPYLDVVAYTECGYDAGEANIPIKYCPWCGEKLY